MKSLVPWPFRQTGRLKICANCGLRASAFGFPWPAAYVTKPTKIDLSLEKDEKINKITIGHSQIFITTSHGNFHIIGPERSILSPGKQPLVTDANFFGAINGISTSPVGNDIGLALTNKEKQQLVDQDEYMPKNTDDDALLYPSVASPPSIN
ncbi:MAG: hypothetical protein GY821_13780 [Gammaproteobacteria bacterium]|nr:hypothetical protein [Gammaproteobacteria bacterium]